MDNIGDVNLVSFEKALQLMKDGYKVTRKSWGEGVVVYIQTGTLRHLKIVGRKAFAKLWEVTHEDILADDWYAVRKMRV